MAHVMHILLFPLAAIFLFLGAPEKLWAEPAAHSASGTEPREGRRVDNAVLPSILKKTEKQSDVSRLHLLSAWHALQAGDLQAASRAYQQAEQLAPDAPESLYGLAAVAVRRGKVGEARQIYRQILERSPLDAHAFFALASLEMDSAQTENEVMERQLKRILVLHPEMAAGHFVLGNFYATQARWQEAEHAYIQAIFHMPDHPDYLCNLAITLDQQGDHVGAIARYRSALRLKEQHPAFFDVDQVVARLRALAP